MFFTGHSRDMPKGAERRAPEGYYQVLPTWCVNGSWTSGCAFHAFRRQEVMTRHGCSFFVRFCLLPKPSTPGQWLCSPRVRKVFPYMASQESCFRSSLINFKHLHFPQSSFWLTSGSCYPQGSQLRCKELEF